MDVPIYAAIITTAGGLVAAVIAGLFAVKVARQKKEAQDQTVATEKMAEEIGERFPYEIGEFEGITTFRDDGTGEHVRRWVNLKTSLTITNLRIPCKFQLSPGAKTSKPTAEPLPGSQLPVHFETTAQTENTMEGFIVLEGLFAPDSGYVGFRVTQPFANAFCLTKEAALEAYRNSAWQTEYATSGIISPAKVLRRSVNFPESHRNLTPPPKAIVFLGDDEVVDQAETARVKPGLTALETSATLVVNDPKVGRRYGISWMPPQAR